MDRLLSSLQIVCFHKVMIQIGSSALAHRSVCFQPSRSSVLTWIVCFGSKDRLLWTKDRLLSPRIVCFHPFEDRLLSFFWIVCFRPYSTQCKINTWHSRTRQASYSNSVLLGHINGQADTTTTTVGTTLDLTTTTSESTTTTTFTIWSTDPTTVGTTLDLATATS